MSQMEDAVKKELQKGGIPPMKGRTIPVLTPTLGRVSMLWADARAQILFPMNVGRFPMALHDKQGGEVGETRNALVEFVLSLERNSPNTEIPYVMWLDDDVIPCSPIVLQALLSHDRPIASGVYFCKGEFGEPLIFGGGSSGTLPFRVDEQFEAWGWSMGLCVTATEVFKKMQADLDLGTDKYGHTAWFKQPAFGIGDDGQVRHGGTEDFHFFENASKLGYRPIIDCTKHTFGYHFDLHQFKGYPEPQFEAWSKRQPVVWPAKGERKEVVWS